MAKRNTILESSCPIENKIYGLIRCIAHEMEAETAKSLKQYGLSNTQLSILEALDNCGRNEILTVNQIKDTLLDESPNVSRSLKRLMEKKWIEKEQDVLDKRVVRIKITKAGIKVHRDAALAIVKKKEEPSLSIEETKILYDLLLKV